MLPRHTFLASVRAELLLSKCCSSATVRGAAEARLAAAESFGAFLSESSLGG